LPGRPAEEKRQPAAAGDKPVAGAARHTAFVESHPGDAAMPVIAVDTPLGRLGIAERSGAVIRVSWRAPETDRPTALLGEAARQIAAYFAGELREFDLPLDPGGSSEQRRILAAMQAIPYGRTRTYGEIAKDLGIRPDEVGQGCAANPIPVIIPCHRVLAAGGLGGYSGGEGVETKIALLKLEGGYPLLL
jgi:methylated-DNA-[protein]-cysteine S-methyltransferase